MKQRNHATVCIFKKFKQLASLSATLLLVLGSLNLSAQEGATSSTTKAAAQESSSTISKNIEKIEVTGSHIKRIQVEGPSPIQVIDREDLEQTGYNSISDVLRDVSASSFGAPREASGSGAAGSSSVSLRGLGANRTLVLLNGKRISIGSADLNLLNMAAVERIEILKDGASATYGSDALGGVVNIITKKDYQGFRFEAQQSATDLKGGEKGHLSLMAGRSTEKFSGLAVLSYKDNRTIYDRNRKWTHLTDVDRYSTIGNPGSYRATDPAADEDDNGEPDPTGDSFAAPDCPTNLQVTNANGTYCAYNWSERSTSLPDLKQLAFLGDSTYEWSPGYKVFSRLSYIRRQVKWRYAAAPDRFNMPNPGGLLTPADPVQASYRLTELGDRVSEITSDVYGVLLGTSGEMGETWEWTAEANLREENTKDRGVSGYARKDVLKALITAGTYRPLSTGDKGDVSSASYVSQTKNLQRVYNIELKAAGEVMDLKHGPLSAAVGTIGAWEEFKTTIDEVTKAGNLFGGSAGEGAGSRNIQSLYTEISAPLLPELELQFAGRVDKYNDFGTTVNPKIAVRWQAQPNLLFRTSVGSGFRAPTTNNLHAGESYGYPTFIDYYACDIQKAANGGNVDRANTPACFAKQYLVRSDGNKNLKEEKSLSYNIGSVYQPNKNLSFSMDIWKIQLSNSIGVSYNAITRAEKDGSNLGIHGITTNRSPNGSLNQLTAPLLNLSKTDLSGIDFAGEYGFRPPGLSKVHALFRLENSVLFEYKSTPFPGSTTINYIGTSGAPQWKNSASLSLSRENHNVYLLARTIAGQKKEVEELGSIPTYTEWDLQYKYNANKYGAITAGVKNILGSTPPLDDSKDSDQGNTDLYEEVGRFVYLNYSYEL